MNALVGYGSSDEEEEDILPQRPAKVAKLEDNAPDHLTAPLDSEHTQDEDSHVSPNLATAPAAHPEAHIETQPLKASTTHTPPAPPQDAPPQGPIAGPAIPESNPTLKQPSATASEPSDAPFSPYTFTRQRLRELTMPPVPNFNIPDAPPPPAQNSEEAATLAAVAKQFERFLELKKQGVHFNERLQNSTSLRNPSLLPKLMAFAEIAEEDCYKSTLPEELAVPARWPEDCYVESLVRQNERREKKRLAERERVDFVPAQGSGRSTPNDGRKSKFDKK